MRNVGDALPIRKTGWIRFHPLVRRQGALSIALQLEVPLEVLEPIVERTTIDERVAGREVDNERHHVCFAVQSSKHIQDAQVVLPRAAIWNR